MKKFMRALGRHTIFCLRWMISRLPYSLFKIFRYLFVPLGWPLLILKRKLVLENLHTAFGAEKDEQIIRKIAKDCFHHFGRGMIDVIYYADRPKMVVRQVTIQGKEHLDRAIAQGNGVIFVSAHFGNFILMYLRILYEGFKTNVIMRRTRDEEFEKYLSKFRNGWGLKTIYDLPVRKCVTECLRVLRNNEVLFILLDQNYGSEGRVFVDFFGQKAATATGPVVFSQRTNASILPIFIQHKQADYHKLVIGQPLKLMAGEDDEQTMLVNIAAITKIIEDQIRQHPHAWGGWMHNRWKSKTVEEQCIIDGLREKSQANC